MRLTDANGIAPGLGVHGDEMDGLLGVFGENKVLEGRFLAFGWVALIVLEDAINLNLEAAAFAVANVGGEFEAAVGRGTLLNAVAGHGILNPRIKEDDHFMVFEIINGGVNGDVTAGVVGGATGCEDGNGSN